MDLLCALDTYSLIIYCLVIINLICRTSLIKIHNCNILNMTYICTSHTLGPLGMGCLFFLNMKNVH